MAISSLSQLTNAATSLSNLILVTPEAPLGYQPQNAPIQNGAQLNLRPGILFHYEGEQSVTLESDITDHYIEDNSAIQDQIALRPEMVTTQGFIGELNNVAPPELALLKALADKLVPISAYAPALTTTALNAYNQSKLLYDTAVTTIDAGVAAWNSISGTDDTAFNALGIASPGVQTEQQKYFQQFYGYYRNRTLFTVQTPWAIFKNMAIKSLRAIQDAETRVISDFEISFKQLRFASTITSGPLDSSNAQGRAKAQAAKLVNLGTSTPPLAPQTFGGLLGN